MATVGPILIGLGMLSSTIFGIWLLVIIFKRSVGWGLGSFFLFIPVGIIFVCMNWELTKKPFLLWLLSFVIMMAGVGMMIPSIMEAAQEAAATSNQGTL